MHNLEVFGRAPSVRFMGWQLGRRDSRAISPVPGLCSFRATRILESCRSRPGLRHAGDRIGRGGVAETVDHRVGMTYEESTSTGLRTAIDVWEENGCDFDAQEARRRAEATFAGRVSRANSGLDRESCGG